MNRAQFRAWLEAYGKAWEERDPGAAAALFSEDVVYHEKPFSEPARGRSGVRDYWRQAVGDHRDVRFTFEILEVVDNRGIALWQAAFLLGKTGRRAGLDGIFVLSFDEDALCQELREWWFYKEAES